MSGHSKWAKIKHKKGAEDAKRGNLFTKLAREIMAAAKEGGGNTDTNYRLRAAIDRARGYNMPSSNIENAIKKGTGELPGVVYENVVFDAYGPGGAAILIEGLTDNKNRTTAEIRNILTKKNGSLAGAGSTAFMFTKKGYVVIEKAKTNEDQLIEIALEVGTDDPQLEGDSWEISCEPTSLENLKSALAAKNVVTTSAEITMLPTTKVKVKGEEAKSLLALMEALEEQEDVQNVYSNFDISEEDLAQAAG